MKRDVSPCSEDKGDLIPIGMYGIRVSVVVMLIYFLHSADQL